MDRKTDMMIHLSVMAMTLAFLVLVFLAASSAALGPKARVTVVPDRGYFERADLSARLRQVAGKLPDGVSHLLIAEVTVVFESDAFNQARYLRKITALSLKESKCLVVSSEILRTVVGSDGVVSLLLVSFGRQPQQGDVVRFASGSRAWELPLAQLQWYEDHSSGAARYGMALSGVRVRVRVRDPDWPSIRQARLLVSIDEPVSRLDIIAENLATHDLVLTKLAITATKESPVACFRSIPEAQAVTLNWDALLGRQDAPVAWTDMKGDRIQIAAQYTGPCSTQFPNARTLRLVLPVNVIVGGGETASIRFRIKEIAAQKALALSRFSSITVSFHPHDGLPAEPVPVVKDWVSD